MPIPDHQTLMLPLLSRLSDGEEHPCSDLVEALSDEFDLIDDEGQQRIPSGPSGTDGIIKEDRLGLDVICLQAKRAEATVRSYDVKKIDTDFFVEE